jgi:hypothetical protein
LVVSPSIAPSEQSTEDVADDGPDWAIPTLVLSEYLGRVFFVEQPVLHLEVLVADRD